MGPATFGITHVLALALAAGILFLLWKVHTTARKLVLRIGSAALMGSIGTVLVSYLLAHIAAPIIMSLNRGVSGYELVSYRFMFWAVFLGLGTLGLMAGGLLGIKFAISREAKRKKNEDE